MTKYIDGNGQILKVSSGISNGETWMTCRVKPSGSLRRVKSKFLPLRGTKEEAQRDLDVHAATYGFKKLSEIDSYERKKIAESFEVDVEYAIRNAKVYVNWEQIRLSGEFEREKKR